MNVPNVNGVEIKRDSWWVTRGGDKVRVVCVDAPEVRPILAISAGGNSYTYYKNGGIHINGGNYFDLIAPYVEPPKPLECWAVVRAFAEKTSGLLFDSRDDAETVAYRNDRIIRMREVTE